MTSRAWLIDLLESIGDDIALTAHLEEKLRGTDDEKERLELEQMISKALTLRREKMNLLLENGESPNPLAWCDVKHALGGYVRMVEVYEANQNPRTLGLMRDSADVFAMALSRFLGMEFEVCARCLADRLLVKQIENDNKNGDLENE